MAEVHRAPAGLRARGKRLWSSVTADFELDEHELALLEDAARTADLIAQLQERIDRDGVMTEAYGGRAHPCLGEVRQQRLALARLLVALRVPSGEESDEDDDEPVRRSGRPQRRGMRGIYAVGNP
ncbi:hypothetical protein BST33_10045 [Mycolicibacter minnesotensis]|uniref:Uncharacterized protein n=1 Tax=Mycolicibacter minnesotensis TaxID=1118379 RepID=A0A7I7R5G5_9MYCO|nr:hypothetical protein [Mycolicibacter minnesotensis]ORB01100.1 hypothetical protein BST33_10045 [Mycolicibacter minnesotensis]BBY33356.1 hypothetical protein MMIN_14170 [Mycolicibacter minnesotensis]